MMKLIASVVVLAAVATCLVLAQSSQSVEYQYCSSALCAPGSCQKQSFPAGECLKLNGKSGASVKLTCDTSAQMCSAAKLYSDDKCTDAQASVDSVCNGCYSQAPGSGGQPFSANFTGETIACGALFGATFWVRGCNDNACAVPTCVPTICPYKTCKKLGGSPTAYGIVQAPVNCNAAVWNFYANSSSCEGTPISTNYWSGHCYAGIQLTCGASSKVAVNPSEQKSITLPKEVLAGFKH